MTRNWSVTEVLEHCRRMWYGATDQYVTGWNNWPCKQDLYRVKFAVDELLRQTPEFLGETEWVAQQLNEQEKQRVWRALNEVQPMR